MQGTPSSALPTNAASVRLSSVQEALWFDQLLRPGVPCYNVGFAMRIDGPLDVGRLAAAVNRVAAANDALRLVLHEEAGVAWQRVLPVVDMDLPLHDFSAHPDAEARAWASLQAAFVRPFDLQDRLPWDSQLFRVGATRHYWLFRNHHLVGDGGHLGLAIGAVLDDCFLPSQGSGPARAPEGPSYLDFVAQDRAYLDSERYRRDEAFWTARFAHPPAPLFPARADTAPGTMPSGRVSFAIDRALFARLEAFTARHDCGVPHLLQALLAIYLWRTQGAPAEVVIGVPLHNRATARDKATLGMFASVIPVATRIDPDQRVTDLMREVAAELRRCYRHQRFPVAHLNRRLRLAEAGRHQLYDAFLGMDTYLEDKVYGPTRVHPCQLRNGHEQTPLAIHLWDYRQGEVVVDINHNTAFLDQAAARALAHRMTQWLVIVLDDDDEDGGPGRVATLPLLDAAERERMLVGWNDTARPWPSDACVHTLIEAQAQRTPEAIALTFDGTELRYAELDARASRLALHLQQLGVGPDDRVGICLARGIELFVALLAVLKAGGACVPMDPHYPAERLAFMLEDSTPRVLLTGRAVRPRLAATAVPCVEVDLPDAPWARGVPELPAGLARAVDARRLAYVIYTSGSTGRPKGVMVEHRAVVNFLRAMAQSPGLGPTDVLLAVTTPCFDMSVLELYLPLVVGARTVIASSATPADGELLADAVRTHGVTVMQATPATWRLMLDSGWTGSPGLKALCGGEPLRAELRDRLLPRVACLWNMYGPTETTVWSTARRVDPSALAAHTETLGGPIANTRVYLLDARLEPVPVGVAGELHIGGAGLARGYLNRPELTAERFIPDPFGPPGARLYKTGDLARWRPDGDLEFLGRNDLQLKVRGFRIEPGEIEACLAQAEGVHEVVVVARETASGDLWLVAYYRAESTAQASPEALRERAQAFLPRHMVPASFVQVAAWPSTPNGKLDRQALPAPGAAPGKPAFEAPQGAVETTLAALWEELLGQAPIGRQDNFFALGGHSLLAARLVSRLRPALRVQATLATVFEHPVLAEQARCLAEARPTAVEPIAPADRSGPLPLSLGQQRLWFLSRLGAGASAAYHVAFALRLDGALDPAALRRALLCLVLRHEALRTCFQEDAGQPRLVIQADDEAGLRLEAHDLRQHPHPLSEAKRLRAEHAASPFDLTRDAPMRVLLLRLHAQRHELQFVLHHIASDRWSLGVMLDELGSLYGAFVRGEPDNLPPLPLQYADYAAWQRRGLAADRWHADARFWQRTLAAAPNCLELPTDRPRPPVQDFAGASVALQLPDALRRELEALGQRHGCTLFMVVLAGWATLLARWGGHEEVVIGSPVAGRDRVELEGLVGFFVNTLALRIGVAGTVTALLARVREQVLDAQGHQAMPFDQVVEVLAPARSPAHNPIFQVMLAWQNTADPQLVLPGLASTVLDTPQASAQCDLVLALKETADGIEGVLDYATALFDRATVQRHLDGLACLLRAMVANPDQQVLRLPMLPEAELALLRAWGAPTRPFPAEHCVHELFEAQARRTPAAIALAQGDLQWDYAALNARANRLAHVLRGRGVGPDRLVAVCLPRGPDWVVALLAVLKAGGAYLPLDPALPVARLQVLLRDARPMLALALTTLGDPAMASLRESGPVLHVAHHAADHAVDQSTTDNLPRAGLTPASLAYVIHTSGSTGSPKGVMLAHRGVCNMVAEKGRMLAIDPGSRMLQFSALGFDVSLCEVLAALCHGATLCLPTHPDALAGQALSATLLDAAITHALLPPAVLATLPPHATYPALRTLVSGGEPCTAELRARWAPGRRFINAYGPAENTVCATMHLCLPGETGTPPIGRPIANVLVELLDPLGQPVPIGVVGELTLGGVQLARGDLNPPDPRAERFVDTPDGRRYRTGDLARWRADGTLVYVGRNDFQLKVRGQRIEPGEVQAHLARFPGVREALVMLREDRPGHPCLVAYCAASAEVTPEALREHALAGLPSAMVPQAFVRLPALPLTGHGKVDRAALPVPPDDALARQAFEPPQGPAETALAALWAELLAVPRVGRQDDFFALGGHSLLAVQLVSRLREHRAVELPLAEVFEHPLLADLAARIDLADAATLPPVTPIDRAQPVALSPAQQRLWFLSRLGQGSSEAYHLVIAFELAGTLDQAALAGAIEGLVRRHEALRTCVVVVDGEPRLQVRELDQVLEVRDLRGAADAADEARRLRAAQAAAPFELACDLPCRALLLRLSDQVHQLQWVLHHIAADGWSVGVLLDELGRRYADACAGRAVVLPPLPCQYADFAAAQWAALTQARARREADFWRQELAGAPARLELPTDRPRPALQAHAGASIEVRLDASLVARLKAMDAPQGTTLYMKLLAGWGALLGRFARQAEVVVGCPVAGRNRVETEALIGFFVNTLALRIDLGGSPSVAELLDRTRSRVLAAQAHQDLPFDQVVAAVQPPRSLAHGPIFQVLLAWHNTPQAHLAMPGLQATPLPTDLVTAQYDLSLSLREEAGEVVGLLNYATALFDRSTLQRHLACWTCLLDAMAAPGASARPVAALDLLPAAEREWLRAWNDTARPYPQSIGVHRLVEAQVVRTPGSIAVVDAHERVSYAELEARANRLAHRLQALDLGASPRVAVCMGRGVDLVVALLATLKSGAAYVPLDPAYPAQRLAAMLRDSTPAALLADAAGARALAGAAASDAPLLDLSTDAATWAALPDMAPAPQPDEGRRAAYVIYTSGSTGQPKGVVVEHHAMVNFLGAMARAPGLQASDALLAVTTACFDIAGLELFLPLSVGGRVVLAPRETAADPRALAQAIVDHDITVMQATPATWRLLLADGWGGAPGLKALCGGEALDRPLAAALGARVGSLWNLYGPTETTVWSARRQVGPVADDAIGIETLGRPIDNTRVQVLDDRLQPVPIGVVGELCIGGAGVARGYLNRPDLERERFIDDPRVPGSRLYRTGDLGRWLASGALEYRGRNDFQLKIRGFRVEPGEIEARLREVEGVREAVVLARDEQPGEPRLVAYVTPTDPDGEPIAVDALRAHAAEGLPPYMLPSAYVVLAALPLTPQGKLDRHALPAPGAADRPRGDHTPPTGPTQQAIAAVWAELLGIARVGSDDDFFELGGHSLLAVRFISRLRQLLQVELPMTTLFAHPGLAALAQAVDGLARTAPEPLRLAEHAGPQELSPAQQRIWFLSRMPGAAAAFHVASGALIEGALDTAALERAWRRVVQRHAALRTRVRLEGGQARQWVDTTELELERHDLGGQDDAEARARALCADHLARPFDLAQDLPIRVLSIRLGAQTHVLQWVLHHIVSDGWSLAVLADEVGRLYAAYARGKPDPLPPLAIQYADHAAWQRRALSGGRMQAQAGFWQQALRGAPTCIELPADRPRPPAQDHAGASLDLRLDAHLRDGLEALGRRHGCTLYMVLLAAWAVRLARLSGQSEVVIGSPVAGRDRIELEPLIGFFVNTLALRIDLQDDPSVADLLARTRDTVLAAQQHADLPFDQVVEAVQPPRDLAHGPLFQVMLAWQNTPEATLALPGLRVTRQDPPQASAACDLVLALKETADGIEGVLDYATALFDRATVQRHLDGLACLLRAMVANPDQQVLRLPMLPEAELALLRAWGAPTRPFPAEHCVHELFEAQARRTPAAIALAQGDLQWDYAALNARANRLAHVLRGQGVGPDRLVAVCLPRGPDWVVALLAVLKAGGAYLPLDPALPAARLQVLLRDARPVLALALTTLGDPAMASLRESGPVLHVTHHAADHAADHPTTDNLPRAGLTPASLAYVIHTSGSTGSPKGVMLAHRGVCNMVAEKGRMLAIDPGSRMLQFSALGFDVSLCEVLAALCHGATLCLPTHPDALAGQALSATLLDAAITHALLPPAVLATLPPNASYPALRTLVSGGEPCTAELRARWAPGRRFINAYGPAENTVCATMHLCLPGETGTPPIGRPIANVRVELLDPLGQPVPIGVVGELTLGGVQLARGDLNPPDPRAERFVDTPDGRRYRTGDLARWRADGTLVYVGRNDFQLKVRGQRIEPGEVQAHLARFPGVREALVMLREDRPGHPCLVAYCAASAEVTPEALREHALAGLPSAMVPQAFVRLPALPLTGHGKVDRAALPVPPDDALARQAFEPPQGPTETALAALWAELLAVPRVGRQDDFFALGGHSLLAVQLVSRLREHRAVELPLAEVFEHPLLAELAARIDLADAATLPPITPVDRAQPVALSPAQQRLWFLSRLGGDASRAYHLAVDLRLQGALEPDALQRALLAIVERHEALRTCFDLVDGQPRQTVRPATLAWQAQDLRAETDPEARCRSLRATHLAEPFDLARRPPLRALLARLRDDAHVLQLVLHHVAADGWSIDRLLQELGTLYTAFVAGRPDPLPPLAIQYADFAAWQRERLSDAGLSAQRAHWRAALDGAPELLTLATDRPRPPVQDHAGAGIGFALDADLVAPLVALGQAHGATLYMTLLASWGILLSRLSGQDEVVIGSPVAGRNRVEVEPLIGCFANTLALRIDLRDDPRLAELLARTRRCVLAAQAHQDLPFDQVVEAVQPSRSRAHGPLFQALLGWQANPDAPLHLPGIVATRLHAAPDTAQGDLGLWLQTGDQGVVGTLDYATALFDAATARRHLAAWTCLLRAMTQPGAADRAVTDLDLLPDAERTRMLRDWNDTARPFPGDRCLHELIEDQVRRTPDAIALVFGDCEVTYAELNARANRLAHHLRTLGAGPDSRVAVCLDRGVELLVGLLATLKAGSAYVPMDPGFPPERLLAMLADSHPVALLADRTARGLAVPWPETLERLELDAPNPPWANASALDLDRAAVGLHARHLAYVIYTSGSTGRPKGVMIEHRGLVNLLTALRAEPGLAPEDTWLAVTTPSFDMATPELYLPLIVGARIAMASRAAQTDAQRLASALREHAASVLQATPATWRMLLASGWTGAPGLKAWCGGEALDGDLRDRLLPLVGSLWNLYGPTETTVWSTVRRVDRQSRAATESIGRPLANTRVYLLDPRRRPVPIGVTGELWIGGDGVARGYLDQPAWTQARFVDDPFTPGARLYRTGDLGRWRADGEIDFLGRTDFQVKVRGFRVELGEIEARLVQFSGLAEAVVIARPDATGTPRLLAYYKAARGAPAIPAEALQQHVGRALPRYMVPAAYVPVQDWPLTPNGKLDRNALPAPDGDAPAHRPWQAPEGRTEVAVAALWCDLLHVDRVGRHDDFFALGGHSLLAVQLNSRLRQALGIEASLGELFDHPELQTFARRLDELVPTAPETIPAVARGGPLPLSLAQQRLWFLTQLSQDASQAYHVVGAVALTGRLDPAPLADALRRIVERHEALRTRFKVVDGEPCQWIEPTALAWQVLDLRAEADPAAAALAHRARHAAAPFDLCREAPFRALLLRVGERAHVVQWVMHHIVSDAWSIGVFLTEWEALHHAFAQGRPDPLPPLAIQYADYAAWQRRSLADGGLERQADFWRETLRGGPVCLALPTDRPRPAVQAHAGSTLEVRLDASLTQALKALGQRHGTTLFMTLLAAWAALLGRLGGDAEVVIGSPVAGRNRIEVEPLIGFFVNTLALRIDLQGDPDVAELLARTRHQVLAAQAHADLPFDQVVEAVQPPRNLAHGPIFQALFAWQNTPAHTLQLPGLSVEPLAPPITTAQCDLSLSLRETGDGIAGVLNYATALFDPATVARQLACWDALLRSMSTDDGQTVARLAMLPAADQARLRAWNRTERDFAMPATLDRAFAAAARRWPAATAIVQGDDRLSYAELDARSNRLARWLVAQGVRAEARVALCMDRGIDCVTALLAILKAGGAYVPMDPTLPTERLAGMLADSAPLAALVQVRDASPALAALFAGLPTLAVSGDATAWASNDASALPASEASPTQLAYVIYTSGSTGAPKGVMVEHASACNLAAANGAALGIDTASRMFQFFSIGFDVCTGEILTALLHGATLCVPVVTTPLAGSALAEALAGDRITHAMLAPAVVATLPPEVGLPLLRALVVGGEACPAELCERWSPGRRFINAYGPTEATVCVSMHDCRADEGATTPIGRPFPNVHLHVLDAGLRPVPIGVVGEVCIGGVQSRVVT